MTLCPSSSLMGTCRRKSNRPLLVSNDPSELDVHGLIPLARVQEDRNRPDEDETEADEKVEQAADLIDPQHGPHEARGHDDCPQEVAGPA